MKSYCMTLTVATALAALCATAEESPAITEPSIVSVDMKQGARRVVNITYKLENAPAIVTLDIQTNGVSIGDANISGGGYLTGEVNKLVKEDGIYVIKWDVASAWPDHDIPSGVRAVVSAWSVDTPPDVIVADLTSKSNVNYYTSIDALPGGLFANEAYRKTKLVMKRIPATGIPWTMGSVNDPGRNTTGYEKAHTVTLTNEYYMGVFELTQSQFYCLTSRDPNKLKKDGHMRPLENIKYVQLRQNHVGNSAAQNAYAYPNEPYKDSLIGLSRAFTGLMFEVPSEAQWEFACRALNGDARWGNGASCSTNYVSNGGETYTVDENLPGRYLDNQATPGNTEANDSVGVENCTAEVGSYECNGFGLYDMHGNVSEWTLDYPVKDRTSLPDSDAHGAPNANGALDLMGNSLNTRIARGGSWKSEAIECRSAYRMYLPTQAGGKDEIGVRLVINVK